METRSTCCYCGTGCGVVIRSEAGGIVDVTGDSGHPANRGHPGVALGKLSVEELG